MSEATPPDASADALITLITLITLVRFGQVVVATLQVGAMERRHLKTDSAFLQGLCTALAMSPDGFVISNSHLRHTESRH